MTTPLRIGLVGLGKIARDQHLPAIAANPETELVAIASRNAAEDGVACFTDIDAMLASDVAIDAIVMCQPPQVRFAAARAALLAGKHVFLEKPPGATISEVDALVAMADKMQVTLFAGWHSQQAAFVEPARQWIAEHGAQRIDIVWKEDVRHWHPGQNWIWQPGGFGVFDTGINALSILTAMVGEPIRLIEAELETPSNRHAPIAARLQLETASGVPIHADFDWRQTGPQNWDMTVAAGERRMTLGHGGNKMAIDGVAQPARPDAEYPRLYAVFLDLIGQRRSSVDIAPLKIAADAFLRGRFISTDPFHD
jgi:D-galactose 1-dehydrogenase